MRNFLLLLSLLIGLSACRSTANLRSTPPTTEALYQQSIEEAMYATTDKVYDQLVAINENNDELVWKTIKGEKYLLVVTWKQTVSYYKNDPITGFYDTGKYPIWITTAPELLQRMKKEAATDPNRRLLELLGLPPNATYSYFVEFWVKPSDLFRPCPDAEITDATCTVCFPDGTAQPHIDWMNASRISRYYACGLYNQYPWTQLGYTYDWNPNNLSHVGLSEFVIRKNSQLVVEKIYTTQEYLAK